MPTRVEGGNILLVEVKKKTEEILSAVAASPTEALFETSDEILRQIIELMTLVDMYQRSLGMVPDIYTPPTTALTESTMMAIATITQTAATVLQEFAKRAKALRNIEDYKRVYARTKAFFSVLPALVVAMANRITNNSGVVPIASPPHTAIWSGVAPLAVKSEELEVAPNAPVSQQTAVVQQPQQVT